MSETQIKPNQASQAQQNISIISLGFPLVSVSLDAQFVACLNALCVLFLLEYGEKLSKITAALSLFL